MISSKVAWPKRESRDSDCLVLKRNFILFCYYTLIAGAHSIIIVTNDMCLCQPGV